ncbi:MULTISPECIES: DUF2312 domain-containing protein [Agrobacterium]|uniref:DUF2312 domain-containing protein n=1 Tax=Agrobacterium TaxID=357 RepID=UPI0021CFD767|nr:DUF2312 domain-containing protein [Agrobacterium tumefaciens]UXS23119.1 DUF2312 domain-containing protein [Agrobacterium tumefaciens]
MSDIGHNSETVAAAELRQFCERRERLEEDKAAIQEDIKELNAEVKARGYDLKTYNEMIKLRKLDPNVRAERETLRQVYGEALGVFG